MNTLGLGRNNYSFGLGQIYGGEVEEEFKEGPWGGPGGDWYRFKPKQPPKITELVRDTELITELVQVEVPPPQPVIETVSFYALEVKALEQAIESIRIQIAAAYEQISIIAERDRFEALRLARQFEIDQIRIQEFEARLEAERQYLLKIKRKRQDEEDLMFILMMN